MDALFAHAGEDIDSRAAWQRAITLPLPGWSREEGWCWKQCCRLL